MGHASMRLIVTLITVSLEGNVEQRLWLTHLLGVVLEKLVDQENWILNFSN